MRKRIILGSVAIIGCLAVAAVIILGWPVSEPRLRLTGGGMTTVGETSVLHLSSNNGIELVVGIDNIGPSGSGTESSLFRSTASGFFSSADGKRIDWEWRVPRKNGGDFRINGTPHDLTNGALLLVTTKGGQIQVAQLDVDLSKVEADKKGFEALAKKEPRVAKFIADAAGKK